MTIFSQIKNLRSPLYEVPMIIGLHPFIMIPKIFQVITKMV